VPAGLTEPDDRPSRVGSSAGLDERAAADGLHRDVEPTLGVLDVGHRRRTEFPQPRTSFRGSRDRGDVGAGRGRELDDVVPDPAAGPGDQQPTAEDRARATQQSQRSQPGQRQCCGRRHGDVGRDFGQRRRRDRDALGPARVRDVPDDASALGRSATVRSRGDHPARNVLPRTPALGRRIE